MNRNCVAVAPATELPSIDLGGGDWFDDLLVQQDRRDMHGVAFRAPSGKTR